MGDMSYIESNIYPVKYNSPADMKKFYLEEGYICIKGFISCARFIIVR